MLPKDSSVLASTPTFNPSFLALTVRGKPHCEDERVFERAEGNLRIGWKRLISITTSLT